MKNIRFVLDYISNIEKAAYNVERIDQFEKGIKDLAMSLEVMFSEPVALNPSQDTIVRAFG